MFITLKAWAHKLLSYRRLFLYSLLFICFFSTGKSYAVQTSQCDEVPVTLVMEHLGKIELSSILCNQEVYYSVPELFDFLKIKNLVSEDFSVIEGFVGEQENQYKIDHLKREIIYKGRTILLEDEDVIRTRTNLFLNARIIEEVFGLKNQFNARFLSANLQAEFELPSVRMARREKMRANLRKTQRYFTADTTILRDYPLFHFGAAAWNIQTSQRTDGIFHNRGNFGFGGLLAGGEFEGQFNYSSSQDFGLRNQVLQWRYVNNNNDLIKQARVGNINTRSVATVYNPIIGVQLTNSSTEVKKSFGTYTLSDYTNPGWIVELYINNVLVDYLQADSSGFYSFEVPLMYGNSEISLRFYGPWGEEEVTNRHFNIPFHFLPDGQFQYEVSAGVVKDRENSRYFNGKIDYGLNRRITIGGGVEYLSSLNKSPVIPFLQTSVRLPGNVLLSGKYINEVGYMGNLNYSSPSNLRVELNYSQYEEEQEAVRFNYLQEREGNISFPFEIGKISGTSRFSFRQHLFRYNTNSYFEWLLSGRILGMRMNLTNTAFLNDYSDPMLFTRISTSIRLPKNFIFSPKLEYEYWDNQVTSVDGEIRKSILEKAYLRASYNYDFRYDLFRFSLGVNFDLPFSRVHFNNSVQKDYAMFSQSAGGSMVFDPDQRQFTFDRQVNLGRGSIRFVPFLDIDGDGKIGASEPQIEGLNVHSANGGLREQVPGGATIFSGLEPYISYHFRLDSRNLERIGWQLEHESMNIFVNPNQVKVVEVPIKVVGEVAGFVYHNGIGISGIRINIYNADGKKVADVLSHSDGYFSYLGLQSGAYSAQVDLSQLDALQMKESEAFHFTISNTEDGDYVDNLEFHLSDRNLEHASKEEISTTEGESEGQDTSSVYTEGPPSEEGVSSPSEVSLKEGLEADTGRAETSLAAPSESGTKTLGEGAKGLVYKVQLLSSERPLPKGHKIFRELSHVVEQFEDNRYTYTWGATLLPGEAARLQNELRRIGFSDAFVVHYYNGQRISVKKAVEIRREHQEPPTPDSIPSLRQSLKKSPVKKKGPEERSEKDKIVREKEQQEGLHFKVQILASKPKLNLEDPLFNGLEGVEEHRHEGFHKYTWGSSSSFEEANQMKNSLRGEGFPDAFVVPFYNNERLNPWQVEGRIMFKDKQLIGIGGIVVGIFDPLGNPASAGLSEADGTFKIPGLKPGEYTARLDQDQLSRIGMLADSLTLSFQVGQGSGVTVDPLEYILRASEENGSEKDEPGKNQGLVFKVQVFASVPKLPVTHELLKGLKGLERYKHQGLYKYTTGESHNLQEVRKIKNELQKKGFEDAFIVPFYNGVRMKMQEMTGRILFNSNGQLEGIEGIRINIYDEQETKVTTLVSQKDGGFSFLGLRPGTYRAQPEQTQLKELDLVARRASIVFKIGKNQEGEIPHPVNFVLEKSAGPLGKVRDDKPQDNTIFKVQIAASNIPLSPNHPALVGFQDVEVYKHEGMYKYTIGETDSLQEAQHILRERAEGSPSAFVIAFRDGKRVSLDEVKK